MSIIKFLKIKNLNTFIIKGKIWGEHAGPNHPVYDEQF